MNLSMNFILKIFVTMLSLLMLLQEESLAQGCSDAGVCTIGNFKPNRDSMGASNNQVNVGVFFGAADHEIFVYGNYVEYRKQFISAFRLDLKLTTLAQSGNGISVFGFSDMFVIGNYIASKKLKLALGGKVPLSDGNKLYNSTPLPMDYQASLGTFDLIFGIGSSIGTLQLAAAIQQPLTQNNNQFLANDSNPVNEKLATFQSTNRFRRSGDVLMRISYPFFLNDRVKVTPSISPIYHWANDHYSDESNVEREISGSRGLTVNGNLYLGYEISRKSKVEVSMGFPFVVRDSRPDGTTRSFLANIEYGFNL